MCTYTKIKTIYILQKKDNKNCVIFKLKIKVNYLLPTTTYGAVQFLL